MVQVKHRNIGSSPASPQKTYLYTFFVQDYFLYHLLKYEKKVPTRRELFGTKFLTSRYLREEATYGKKYTREDELALFKHKEERLQFIYNPVKIQQMEEAFFRIWNTLTTYTKFPDNL